MKSLALYLLVFAPIAAPGYCAKDQRLKDWSFLLYHGQSDENRFLELLLFDEPSRPLSGNLTSFEASKKIGAFWKDHISAEGAFNLTRRWERPHQENFWEQAAHFVLRWRSFPWNHLVQTTVAFGEGLSYAQRIPRAEIENPKSPKENTSHLLNYLSHEITFGTSRCKDWSLVYRLHHRSGVFGLFGKTGSSNVQAFGLRYSPQSDCSTFL